MDKVDRGRLDIHIMRRMDEEYARMDHVDAIAVLVIAIATMAALIAALLLTDAIAADINSWICCIVWS